MFDQVAERYGFRKLDQSKVDDLRHFNIRQLLSQHDIPIWKLPLIARHLRLLIRLRKLVRTSSHANDGVIWSIAGGVQNSPRPSGRLGECSTGRRAAVGYGLPCPDRRSRL